MKILMITDLYPLKESETDTSQTISNFVQAWTSQGHEVDVIKPNFLLSSLINKKTIYPTGWYGNVYNVNYFTPFLFNIKNKLKDFDFSKYDKIFAHRPSGEIFASHLGLDFIAGVHSADFEFLSNSFCKFYFKQELETAYKKASRIMCRSYELKTKFIKEFPMYIHKTSVTLTGVDIENNTITEIKNKPCYMDGIKSVYKRVLTCVEKDNQNYINRLINACKNIEKLQLTVVDNGDSRAEFVNETFDVVFLNKLSQDRLTERMRASDIFVVSSNNPDAKNLCYKAMANNCVILYISETETTGFIIDGQNGFVCNAQDIEAKLNEIVNYPDLKQILANATEFANKSFDEVAV